MGVLSLRSSEKPEAALARLAIPKIETVPSDREKRAQWNAARERLNECDARIKRTKEQRNPTQASMEDRATDSLQGKPISTSGPREDLSALYEERQILALAVNMAKQALDQVDGEASVELCARLFPEFETRVEKMAACAIALVEAAESVAQVRDQIRAAGYSMTSPIAAVPTLAIDLGRPEDWNSRLGVFLRALRSKGLKV
ncbi:hypothetical protein [Candidatus Binatus sp.]|uniref:hypothetical protein n=1 Tax=Candidatus Binatus sp. TaxID=2811406 RepID=UPI003CA65126